MQTGILRSHERARNSDERSGASVKTASRTGERHVVHSMLSVHCAWQLFRD